MPNKTAASESFFREYLMSIRVGGEKYLQFSDSLGGKFVERACEIVCQQENLKENIRRTWIDNYVLILEEAFTYLQAFLNESKIKKTPSTFLTEDWNNFSKFLEQALNSAQIAAKTKSKRIFLFNSLSRLLKREGLICARFEISVERSINIADNASEISVRQKGFLRKKKIEKFASPFSFYVENHGRYYDYEEFRSVACKLLLLIVPHLQIFYTRFAAGTAKQAHNTLVSLLRYLRDEVKKSTASDFFARLASDSFDEISDVEWEAVVAQWRESLKTDNADNSIITHHMHVKQLERLWASLAAAQLLPQISIAGFKNAKSRANKESRQSLAQLSPRTKIDKSLVELPWNRLKKYFDKMEQREAFEFIHALCSELSADVVKRLSTNDLIESIHKLNDKRLDECRAAAENEFLKWYQHWQYGQDCLAAVSYSAHELIYLLDSPELNISEKRYNSAALLFSERDQKRRIGNCLLYVDSSQKGVITGVNGRYHHIARSLKGRANLQAYLHPHNEAILSLWVLLLIDTGANCEVSRGIPWDCLKQTGPGYSRILLGNKDRAGGKIIVDEFSDEPPPGFKLSLPNAIRLYKTMAHRYHNVAEEDSKDFLLLTSVKSEVQKLEEWTARAWFKAFLKRHEPLRELDARPSMIRPSVLLSIQHKNADNVVAAKIIADHTKSETTQIHYTGRAPTKLKYNLMIREFTERFQAVTIASITGAADKLGLTEDEFKKILSDAHRTGLGVACLDPLAGVQLGTKSGEPCTRMDACSSCKMRYVVATVDNVADLFLFNAYLKSAQDTQAEIDPVGWQQRWLPWLVFSDIALSKLSQGETAKIYTEAITVASSRKADYMPLPLS